MLSDHLVVWEYPYTLSTRKTSLLLSLLSLKMKQKRILVNVFERETRSHGFVTHSMRAGNMFLDCIDYAPVTIQLSQIYCKFVYTRCPISKSINSSVLDELQLGNTWWNRMIFSDYESCLYRFTKLGKVAMRPFLAILAVI